MSSVFPLSDISSASLWQILCAILARADCGYKSLQPEAMVTLRRLMRGVARNLLDLPSGRYIYMLYKRVEYRMALSIKNVEVEQLARELARRRHVSVTEAIRQSLEREVARERLVPRDEASDLFQRLMEISDRAGKVPKRENAMTDDEILGYDEFGIPSK
jgi:antitoxin VapB